MIKQTHTTYASILVAYRGKQGIKKQNSNIQYQCFFFTVIQVLLINGFIHNFSLQKFCFCFVFDEIATDFNESSHSSKLQAPIPQRFNWIDLSFVSQLTVRILVFMFQGSKTLLRHINPFFYSYSILLFSYVLSILSSTHIPFISSSICSITSFYCSFNTYLSENCFTFLVTLSNLPLFGNFYRTHICFRLSNLENFS